MLIKWGVFRLRKNFSIWHNQNYSKAPLYLGGTGLVTAGFIIAGLNISLVHDDLTFFGSGMVTVLAALPCKGRSFSTNSKPFLSGGPPLSIFLFFIIFILLYRKIERGIYDGRLICERFSNQTKNNTPKGGGG
uniref:Uncharacterized protein n=1 Tax=Morchella brunnea TaxID=1174671 RepID=A0A8K1I7Y4_9PEZI|nr:hypothetical protein LK370_mgp239 [Morchella brunnea]UBU98349.1 hypothetical protein [Morchella brunnea]